VGHVARKRFGQHFLADSAVIDAIVAAIAPRPGEALVEIGPGLGAMTQPLLERCGHLTVIELDRDLAAKLRRDARLDVVQRLVQRRAVQGGGHAAGGLKFGAVERVQGHAHQPLGGGEAHDLAKELAERGGVGAEEAREGVVIGAKVAGEPESGNDVGTSPLQAPGGADPLDEPEEPGFDEHVGGEGRASGLDLTLLEAQRGQVQRFHHVAQVSRRVIRAHPLVQTRRELEHLLVVRSLRVAHCPNIPRSSGF
jgi:hypothetical protein